MPAADPLHNPVPTEGGDAPQRHAKHRTNLDANDAALFRPLVKRSITIAGHPTSVTLEPLFWEALIRESVERDLPVNALVARIDADRLAAPVPPNLASAIRLWLLAANIAGKA